MTSSAVFSMFGGGAKKEKKDVEEGRGDVSGSNKAQREAAAAAAGKDGDEVSADASGDGAARPYRDRDGVMLTRRVG